jgi:hypothetical protein
VNIDMLDEKNLSLLVDIAVTVLAESLGEEERDRLVDLTAIRAAAELTDLLSRAGVADADALVAALNNASRRDLVARRLIHEVLDEPEVSGEVVAAYEQRKSMMILDGGLITGPLLLAIVVLRLKRLKAGKEGVDVEFEDSEGLRRFFDLLGGGRGGG